MSRSRKNAGIIGKLAGPENNSQSGFWSMDDSSYLSNSRKLNTVTANPNTLIDYANSDPYYNYVAKQFTDVHYTDHVLKDKSTYTWDEFYYPSSTTRPLALLSTLGPRYRDWYSNFSENANYSVADYASLRFGSSTFTIEFWIKLSRYDSLESYVISKGSATAGRTAGGSGWTVYVSTTRTIGFYDGGSNVAVASSSALAMDTWYHVAIVRTATTTNGLKIYINGANASGGTGTSASTFSGTEAMIIGRDRTSTATTGFSGNLTDIRISNTAVYSGDFATPTAALTMTGASTVFSLSMLKPHHDNIIANHAQAAAITIPNGTIRRWMDGPFFVAYPKLSGHGSHSVFNQTTVGSYKIYEAGPNSTALRLGAGAFTIECWVYFNTNGISGNGTIAAKGNGNAGAGAGWNFRTNNSGFITFDDGITGLSATATPGILYPGSWYHMAAVRTNTSAGGFKMYVNGALMYTGTVSTTFSESDAFRMFSSKNDQYGLSAYACGLRISNTARYSAAFDVESTTFIDNSMTTDANALLCTATCGTNTPRPPYTQYVPVGYAPFVAQKRSNATPTGKYATSRTGMSFVNRQGGNNQYKVVVVEANNCFDFGTGDFSVELWIKDNNGNIGVTQRLTIIDTRSDFNTDGFCIDSSGYPGIKKLTVVSSGKVILADNTTIINPHTWYHVCLQRVSNYLALYVDGIKVDEINYGSTAINCPANRLTLFNNSYGNLQNNWGWGGNISDVRVLKGSAAYAMGTTNPETFKLPTEPLPYILNTQLLISASTGILRDTSPNSLKVTAGGRDDANFTSAWDIYPSGQGPYPAKEVDRDSMIPGDMMGSTQDGMLVRGFIPGSATAVENGYAWMTHLVVPWTIETWFVATNTDPATPGNQYSFYTASAAGQEGFQIQTHTNNAGSASWGNICFMLWTQHNSGVQRLGTTSGTLPYIQPHSWNHLAVVFDPTKSNRLSIHVNGKRVATTTSTWTPGQKNYNYDNLQMGMGFGTFRISTIARYDNDLSTYGVPTKQWPVDRYTFMQFNNDGPFNDIAGADNVIENYGGLVSFQQKQFGNASYKFTNKETTVADRFIFQPGSYHSGGGATWYNDFTVEFWANWWPAATGGKDFFATYGNVIYHHANQMTMGVNASGYWTFKNQSGGHTTPTINQTLTTTVLCSTSPTAFDHVVMMRKNLNYVFFINGVNVGTLLMGDFGTTTGGPGANYTQSLPETLQTPMLGIDFTSTAGTSGTGWSGHLQDFRFTKMARYETNASNIMVHRGTDIPALPTRLLPTRSYSATPTDLGSVLPSQIGSIYQSGADSGTVPFYYTASNANLALDSSNWTIEFFFFRTGRYYTGTAQQDQMIAAYNASSGQEWAITMEHVGYTTESRPTVWFNTQSPGNPYTYGNNGASAIDITPNTWYHFALVRETTTLKMYINGILAMTSTGLGSGAWSTATQWAIMNGFKGYMSNIRFSKIAEYTSTFRTPTAPLPVTPDTKLLLYPVYSENSLTDKSGSSITTTYSAGSVNSISIVADDPFN